MATDESEITSYPLDSGRLRALLILLTAGIIPAGFECAAGNFRSAVVVAITALAAGSFLYASISVERLLLAWFALTPVAAFVVRYPTDRSILTFVRAMFLLLAVYNFRFRSNQDLLDLGGRIVPAEPERRRDIFKRLRRDDGQKKDQKCR